MARINKKMDIRIIGETGENIFISLINQKGTFCTSFDTESLDAIAFQEINENQFFKGNYTTVYAQIKVRGSKTNAYNSQGHDITYIEKIKEFAREILKIEIEQLYFVVGFFKNNSIIDISYYIIPFGKALESFKGDKQYRFSYKSCEEKLKVFSNIVKL